jgi:hypothetical protein
MENIENTLSLGRLTPAVSKVSNNNGSGSQSTLTPTSSPSHNYPKNINALESPARNSLFNRLSKLYRINSRPNDKTVGQFVFGRFKNTHFKEKVEAGIKRLIDSLESSNWHHIEATDFNPDNVYIHLLSENYKQFIISFHFTGIRSFKEKHSKPVLRVSRWEGSEVKETKPERKYRKYIEEPAILWPRGPSGAFHIKYLYMKDHPEYIRLVPKESDVLDFYFATSGTSTYAQFLQKIQGDEDLETIKTDLNELLKKINAAQIPTVFVDDFHPEPILRPLAQLPAPESFTGLDNQGLGRSFGGPAGGMGGSSSAFSRGSEGFRKRKTRKSSSRARARARARKSRARA